MQNIFDGVFTLNFSISHSQQIIIDTITLCKTIHTALRLTSTQIAIGYCTHFISVRLVLVWVSVNAP